MPDKPDLFSMIINDQPNAALPVLWVYYANMRSRVCRNPGNAGRDSSWRPIKCGLFGRVKRIMMTIIMQLQITTHFKPEILASGVRCEAMPRDHPANLFHAFFHHPVLLKLRHVLADWTVCVRSISMKVEQGKQKDKAYMSLRWHKNVSVVTTDIEKTRKKDSSDFRQGARILRRLKQMDDTDDLTKILSLLDRSITMAINARARLSKLCKAEEGGKKGDDA